MDVMHSPLDQRIPARPAPTQPPDAERSAKSWPSVVLGVAALGGAGLMLYGNSQNATGGAWPPASVVGTATVVALAVFIVVAATVHSMRANAAERLRDPRRVRLHCTTCDTTIPGGDRGSRETETLANSVRRHEERSHLPYDPTIRNVLEIKIALALAGTVDLPTEVRHYRLTDFAS